MACVNNKTARQFNLKCIAKSNGNRVTVRLAPGFNIIDDAHWHEFVSKDGKVLVEYIDFLKKNDLIEFGEKVDDLELDKDADTVSKSKSVPMPKKSKKD